MQEDGIIARYVCLEASNIDTPPQRIENFCQKIEDKLGFRSYRWQVNVISDVFHGADIVVIAGTRSGKSLCFQAIPLVKYGAIVLVILPTIALMENQVSLTEILKW